MPSQRSQYDQAIARNIARTLSTEELFRTIVQSLDLRCAKLEDTQIDGQAQLDALVANILASTSEVLTPIADDFNALLADSQALYNSMLAGEVADLHLTGAPTADAPAPGDNSSRVITSAFLVAYIATLKAVANGLATLDGGGKVPTTQLPALAITDTFEAASEAAMLALAAQKGDVAIRSDINKSFVLSADDPAVLANWKELKTPTDAVLSVAGLTGAIAAGALKTALALVKADVGLGNVDNTSDANKPVSTAQQTALDAKLDRAALPRLHGGIAPCEGLTITYINTPRVDVAASFMTLFDASGNAKRFTAVTRALQITTSGAGGLDTGAEAASTWYHVWGIGTEAGAQHVLLSTSATAPTLPGGYTYKGYLGAVYNDASSNFVPLLQIGNEVLSSVTGLVTNGVATDFTAINLAAAVPPTARRWLAAMNLSSSSGTNSIAARLAPAGASQAATYGDAAIIAGSIGTTIETDSPKECPIQTAQTVYYRVSGTNAQVTIHSVGWRF